MLAVYASGGRHMDLRLARCDGASHAGRVAFMLDWPHEAITFSAASVGHSGSAPLGGRHVSPVGKFQDDPHVWL